MRTNFKRSLRAIIVAVVLGFCAAPQVEARFNIPVTTSATVRAEPRPSPPQRDPVIGVIALVGGVAVLVFLIWVAIRIGDSGR